MKEDVIIHLNETDAELFIKFRQYQSIWERLFAKDFTGSLTLHIQQGKLRKNEWRNVEKLSTT